jgi:hypothetical protein
VEIRGARLGLRGRRRFVECVGGVGVLREGSLCDGRGGQRLTGLVASEHREIYGLFAGGIWKWDEIETGSGE